MTIMVMTITKRQCFGKKKNFLNWNYIIQWRLRQRHSSQLESHIGMLPQPARTLTNCCWNWFSPDSPKPDSPKRQH